MADTIKFELVSPEALVLSTNVEMVVVPAQEGDVGILPGHSLLIATVRPGTIAIHESGIVKEEIFVAGGFLDVNPESCTVLAEEAISVLEIDKAKADERLAEAKKAVDDAGEDGKDAAEAKLKVAEAYVAAAAKAA